MGGRLGRDLHTQLGQRLGRDLLVQMGRRLASQGAWHIADKLARWLASDAQWYVLIQPGRGLPVQLGLRLGFGLGLVCLNGPPFGWQEPSISPTIRLGSMAPVSCGICLYNGLVSGPSFACTHRPPCPAYG